MSSRHITAAELLPVAVLGLVWGCNWPVLKWGVTEIAPLTFRALTLPFAALGLLAIAKLAGDSLRIPREHWGKVAVLALTNISAWNGLVLFGLEKLPAGRTAILAYTMPIWSVAIGFVLLHERISASKVVGMALGMIGMGVLLGDDFRHLRSAPVAALYILGASLGWALGTVLLRKWKLPIPQNTLTGWMMLVGSIPLVLLAPLTGSLPAKALSGTAWFAIVYNIVVAGAIGHWAWYTLARTLPVAVSSMSSLPVPVIGVFAGMLMLGEQPRASEWIALGLVVASMFAVLRPPKPAPAPLAPD